MKTNGTRYFSVTSSVNSCLQLFPKIGIFNPLLLFKCRSRSIQVDRYMFFVHSEKSMTVTCRLQFNFIREYQGSPTGPV